MFLEAQSFHRASLSENCSLHRTDNVRGQISEHIFAPNGGYCLYNNQSNERYRAAGVLLVMLYTFVTCFPVKFQINLPLNSMKKESVDEHHLFSFPS